MKVLSLILTMLSLCSHTATMVFLCKAGCRAIDTKYAQNLSDARDNAGKGQTLVQLCSATATLTVTLLAGAIVIATRQ